MPAAAPAPATFAGDDFSRRQTFTQPRTIVLDTRYDGAVGLGVWTGYAVMVVNRSGARRVIVGPHTHLLEYDETLQSLELSTGTPKTDAKLYRTVYLRALNNKVSDVVEAETRDLCRVQILLSYRVNFEGDPGLWFNVENYVKFLTDHLRSLIRHAVKQQGVEGFYAQSAAVLRDVILGRQDESGKRPGRRFEENGMHVYDVEVLDVTLGDGDIAKMLLEAQHASVRQALSLAAERRKLELTRETELTRRAVSELQSTTRLAELSLRQTEHAQTTALRLAEVQSEAALETERKAVRAAEQSLFDLVHAAEMGRTKSRGEVESALEAEAQARRLAELQAEVRAVVEKAQAVSPDLVAALQAFGDRALAAKMAESMAPLAILGGESVAAVLSRLLQGTSLARLLPAESAVTSAPVEG
jgi:major vault protein